MKTAYNFLKLNCVMSTVGGGTNLNDLDLGRMEGDLLPSSSKRLGLDSLDEKCRCIVRKSSVAAGVPTGTAGAATRLEVVARLDGPTAKAAAPSW